MDLSYCNTCKYLIHKDDIIKFDCCKRIFHNKCINKDQYKDNICDKCSLPKLDYFCNICTDLIEIKDLITFSTCNHTFHINCLYNKTNDITCNICYKRSNGKLKYFTQKKLRIKN